MRYLAEARRRASRNLALINLIAFVFSVVVLYKTMKAAERLTERTSKPVICLRRTQLNLSDDELLEPQVNVDALIPFQIRNVGSGTALEIHWRFKAESGDEVIHGMIPNLQPGHYMNTGLNANQVGLKQQGVSRNFECEYRSVNRDRYRSSIKIENRKLVTFEEKKVSRWSDFLTGRKWH